MPQAHTIAFPASIAFPWDIGFSDVAAFVAEQAHSLALRDGDMVKVCRDGTPGEHLDYVVQTAPAAPDDTELAPVIVLRAGRVPTITQRMAGDTGTPATVLRCVRVTT